MDAATGAQFVRFAQALDDLAARHGLSKLRWAGDGRIIADGATYLDIARFEVAAESVLQAGISVILSDDPNAISHPRRG